MPTPQISIITTVFNREKYLEDCIKSVLASSFENWELIIVDDKSKDRSVEIAENYAASDARIRVQVNEQNLGQFENRNYAASLAKGKYLKYLDSDDVLYPHGLQVFMKAAREHPEAGLIISHDQLHESQPYPILMNSHEAWASLFLSRGFPASGPTGALIKRQVFLELDGFPKPFYVGTDILLWLLIASRYPIVKVQPALTWYRTHDEQALSQGLLNNEYLREDYNYMVKYLMASKNPLTGEEKSRGLVKLKKRQLRQIAIYALKTGKVLDALKLLQYNNFNFRDIKYLIN